VRAAELDAVTIDGYGTLLTVVDPVPTLARLLPSHDYDSIANAFRVETAYYQEHTSTGRTTEDLAVLHEQSVAVFNDALGSALSPAEYAGAFEFELLPGVPEALRALRARGLSLAVVANWDISLHARLETAGIAGFFAAVVHAAGKPSPAGILQALEALGVSPFRALHVGDDGADEQAASGAGARFARAPLPEAVASLA